MMDMILLRKHQALFCGELGWSMGVEAASFNLAKSSDLIVNAGTTYSLSVASFGASSAIMCYRDASKSGYGTCNALTLSGTTLSKGSDLIVNAGTTDYVSVASFGASSAIMCYEDSSNSEYGTCNAIGCGAGMNPACRTDSLLTFDLMTGFKSASPGADGCASCGPGDDPLTCKTFNLTNFVPPRDFCFIIFL